MSPKFDFTVLLTLASMETAWESKGSMILLSMFAMDQRHEDGEK